MLRGESRGRKIEKRQEAGRKIENAVGKRENKDSHWQKHHIRILLLHVKGRDLPILINIV